MRQATLPSYLLGRVITYYGVPSTNTLRSAVDLEIVKVSSPDRTELEKKLPESSRLLLSRHWKKILSRSWFYPQNVLLPALVNAAVDVVKLSVFAFLTIRPPLFKTSGLQKTEHRSEALNADHDAQTAISPVRNASKSCRELSVRADE